MDLNSVSRRHLEWLIQNQPELVRDLHNSNKLEDRLEERYQRALELADQIKADKGVSGEEAIEIASDLVLNPAEKDPLAKPGRPISKNKREQIYRKLEAKSIA
jgi:hypothetical protein